MIESARSSRHAGKVKSMGVYKYTGKTGVHYFYKFEVSGRVYKKAIPEALNMRQAEHVERLARQAVFENKYPQFARQKSFEAFVRDVYLPWAKHKKSYDMEVWYCEMLIAHPVFKDKSLSEISQITIERFKQERRGNTRRNKPRSPATINREMACLRKILGLAADNGYLDRNPAVLVPAFPGKNQRNRVLSDDENTIMLAQALHDRFERIFPIAVLARYAGMRRGEILLLEREHVDMNARLLKLSPDITKSNKYREIPMCGLVADVLAERDTQRVFAGYPSKQQVSTLFGQAVKLYGIQGVGLHVLRHTIASRMEDYGIGAKEIRDILGHAPKDTTEGYQHSTPESRERAMRMIEEHDPLSRGLENVLQAAEEGRVKWESTRKNQAAG